MYIFMILNNSENKPPDKSSNSKPFKSRSKKRKEKKNLPKYNLRLVINLNINLDPKLELDRMKKRTNTRLKDSNQKILAMHVSYE